MLHNGCERHIDMHFCKKFRCFFIVLQPLPIITHNSPLFLKIPIRTSIIVAQTAGNCNQKLCSGFYVEKYVEKFDRCA